MDEAKLNRWAEKLLDVGKRNPLVSYHDLKTSTVEALLPSSDELFDMLSSERPLKVFDPKLSKYEDDLGGETTLAEGAEPSIGDSSDSSRLSSVSSNGVAPQLSRSEYLDCFGSSVKTSEEVLLYSAQGAIKSLKSIKNRAKTSLEESGINTAYAAFGFVHWREVENSALTFCAPVLLVPLAVENESPVKPFFIRSTGDDVVSNPTFAYKVFVDYGVKLPEYAEGGLSEHLAKVAEAVRPLGWEVSSECKLGLFSFLKINMYHDLRDNAERILNNKIVQALLDNPDPELARMPGASEAPVVKNPLVELHNILDADSSQIEAIEMAKSGRSFVLEGPPGTGKSQTIANIIAECLYDGKRVLFVSEKQAALNVVYEKLSRAGMRDFCLELHSHKANRKAVIAELGRTLELSKSAVAPTAQLELEKEARLQRNLDDCVSYLHKIQQPVGRSLFELIEDYCSCADAPEVRWAIPDLLHQGATELQETQDILRQFAGYERLNGRDYRTNPWYGCCLESVDFETKVRAQTALDDLSRSLERLRTLQGDDATGLCPSNVSCLYQWRALALLLAHSTFITPAVLSGASARSALDGVQVLARLETEIEGARAPLAERYDEAVFELDAPEIYRRLTEQYSSFFSRLFSGEYRSVIARIQACSRNGEKPSYEQAVDVMMCLGSVARLRADYDERMASLEGILGKRLSGTHVDWVSAQKELSALCGFLDAGVDLASLEALDREGFSTRQRAISVQLDEMMPAFELLDGCACTVRDMFAPDVFDVMGVDVEALLERCQALLQRIDDLPDWVSFSKTLKLIDEKGLMGFVNRALDQACPPELLERAYKKAYCRQWAETLMYSASPALPDRVAHDELVRSFKAQDERRTEISKAQVRAAASTRRPDLSLSVGGSSVSKLRRETNKKSRQMPVRRLFDELGDLVQILKPCLLMSPLSVSTFVGAEGKMHFDVVIFDEASQIFPWDAIGSIYRADQAVVVGDTKQMPPSSFFAAGGDVDEEDEEAGDVTDFESILDLCASVLPQKRLSWHYRSRSEELIAFSNYNFYGNGLLTFPSAREESAGMGVEYFYVKDGVFDRRSHTNRAEAQRVVDLVFENVRMRPEMSLGVVAFSKAQMDLIERLIDRRRIDDPSFESYFSQARPEPFFVKNLETVQGDERDVIIFSTAYGRDAQGRFLHNFGPLNREGGERRLNVAVTRAKHNVQLVTSIHHTDIDLSRTAAEGARLLKAYLDYAENGSDALRRQLDLADADQFDSPFEVEVCTFLRGRGYCVDTQVGCSGYRIDLAVRRRDNFGYALAVECDGASYHSSRNARDRDRLRQEVLEGMGWSFYRVWSTDWFRDPVAERERLVSAVEDALSVDSTPSEKRREQADASDVPETDLTPTGDDSILGEWDDPLSSRSGTLDEVVFPEYEQVDINRIHDGELGYDSSLPQVLLPVFRKEAPLSEEWLLQRIAFLYGKERVSSVVRQRYEVGMRGCGAFGIERHNGFVYLKDQEVIRFRIPGALRKVEHIALEELASGMETYLRQNVSIGKRDLFSAIARMQGCRRVGDKVKARLEAALALVKGVRVEGDTVSLDERP